MKKSKALLSAIVLASASLVSQGALAGKIETKSTVELIGNTAQFGNLFTGHNAGQLFSDTYTFTTSALSDFSADLFLKTNSGKNGLGITTFSLFNADGELLSSSAMAKGVIDLWSLNYDDLAAGSYYIQVSGSLLSNAAGKYSASLALGNFIDIPEPATYGMMLGGLGLLGLTARRRKVTVEPAA